MKKILKILMAAIACVFAIPATIASNLKASAATAGSVISYSNFESTVNSIISEYAIFDERLAGSEDEKNASEYIKEYLDNNTSLVARNDAYIKDGVQTFKFESIFSGVFETSQNIIYTLKSNKATEKKIIIGGHYDALAYDLNLNSETYGQTIASEGINGSAGSVATMLTLAKYLSADGLDFNIEFVFFGAGESNRAGSNYYTTGITEEDKENIICMINLSQIAYGENLYFYMNEVSTKSANFVEDVTYEGRVDIEKINTAHLNKVLLENENNELGLGYTHVALDSDNINFMKEGIETINIFAGDYSNGIIIGRQEFEGADLITYTANDNIAYILENKEDYVIAENLYEVYKTIFVTITSDAFVSTFEASAGSTDFFYKVFTNSNLVLYLTVVVFIVLVVVALYVYYKLSVKAYYANIEMEFLSSVMKISDQLDKNGKDDTVAKVVSQVIANDIKKDKVIKVKKSKKDKEDK